MPRRRSWIVLAIVALVVLALAVQRTTGPARGAAESARDTLHASGDGLGGERPTTAGWHLSLSDDRSALLGSRPDAEGSFTLTLEAWQAWAAEHLVDRLGDVVRIGEQEMPPERFDAFGEAAASPDGDRIAVTVTAYAMLTTVSVVTLLDPETMTLDVVREPAFGGASDLTWSPSGRYLAYTLDTARARGDALRIDDTVERRPVRSLDAADVLAAAGHGVPAGIDERSWLPRFRDPTWFGDERLLVTTDDPASAEEPGEARWSVPTDGSPVERREATPPH